MSDKPYKYKIRLDKPRAVQRLLARTINLMLEDEISDNKARTIGYLCNILLSGFETCDTEERVTLLEEKRKAE